MGQTPSSRHDHPLLNEEMEAAGARFSPAACNRRPMRKLKIIEHISLDGVIQVSGEDGDFPYGDWTAPYRTPAGRDAILAAHGESFDLLLGRRTYARAEPFEPSAGRGRTGYLTGG